MNRSQTKNRKKTPGLAVGLAPSCGELARGSELTIHDGASPTANGGFFRLLVVGMLLLPGAHSSRAQSLERTTLEQLEEQAFRSAVLHAAGSIVQLRIIGGAERVDGVTMAEGPTTGVVLSSDGYVVTSLYRFVPPPVTVLAILADGKQFAAKVVATDQSRKLVLLKLQNAEGLAVTEPAPADSYRVGQWAIALGQTYRADRPNVSVGILSAKRRIFGRALQTDAAVSAANYGGPLIDIEGRVLGILAPMSPGSEKAIAGVDWYDSGIGFAVPLEAWMPAMERLKTGKDLQRGVLGVTLSEGSPRETPAKIKEVISQGPAAEVGIEVGDLVTQINGQPIATHNDLKFAITPHYAGDTLTLTLERDGQSQEVEVTLTTIAHLQELAKE